MKKYRVGVFKRKNKDESVSFYIRWSKMDGSKGIFCERVVRASPVANKAELRNCEREAWVCAREKEKSMNEGAHLYVTPMNIVTAGDHYIRLMDGHLSESSVSRLCRVLPDFVKYVLDNGGASEVHKLLPHRIVRYRDWLLEKGLNKSTICLYLSDLSGWLNWCVGESYCISNPADKKRVNYPRRTNDKAADPLTLEGAEQYWRLIERLKTDYDVAIVGFLACSGLRIGEARTSEWFAYKPEDGTLSVHTVSTKTKKHQRTIPTCDALRGYLLMLRMINDEGRYIIGTDEGRKQISTQAATALKPFGVTPHDLRRWFRTALETTSPRQFEFIDDIMGHRASRTRQAYARRHNVEAYRPIMRRFNDWLMYDKPDMFGVDIPADEVV